MFMETYVNAYVNTLKKHAERWQSITLCPESISGPEEAATCTYRLYLEMPKMKTWNLSNLWIVTVSNACANILCTQVVDNSPQVYCSCCLQSNSSHQSYAWLLYASSKNTDKSALTVNLEGPLHWSHGNVHWVTNCYKLSDKKMWSQK